MSDESQTPLEQIKILIEEYNPHQSDWGFRRECLRELIAQLEAEASQRDNDLLTGA